MRKLFSHNGGEFEVAFEKGIVSVENNDHLWAFVNTDPMTKTSELVDWVQAVHADLYGNRLKIADRSFIMEIWGHIYFEFFMLRNEKIGRVLFPFGLYKRLVASCEEVDCGESHIDHNRWLWDILGILTPLVGRLIPSNSLS